MYSKKPFLVLIVVIIVLVAASRLVLLDLRPLHHDEGVNYFFAKNIVSGDGYRYDPLNYHGPFYFFVLALSFLVFGISEFSLRFPAAVAGIFLALLPLFLFRDYKEKWIISLFLLISPSLLFYSRYSIHESSYVLFSFLSIYFLSLILERRELEYLPYFAICAALLFTIKETAIIMSFVLILMMAFSFKKIIEIPFKENYWNIGMSVILFIFVYALLFTNFFSYWQGLTDSFRSFLPWMDRGMHEIGHDKPFYYYGWLLIKYELPLVILGFAGLFYTFRDSRVFVRNCFIWFLGIFLIYSFISYKTPWLIINMSVPLCFLASFGVSGLWNSGKGRIYMKSFFIISIIYLGFFAVYLNFLHPWQPDNTYAYVHTSADVLSLVATVNGIADAGIKKQVGGITGMAIGESSDIEKKRILIVSTESDYWPLPFYFDDRDVAYLTVNDSYSDFEDYDIFIVKEKLIKEEDIPRGFNHEIHKLRDGVGFWVIW